MENTCRIREVLFLNEKRHFCLTLNEDLTSRGTLFLPGNPGHPGGPVRPGAATRGSGTAAGVPAMETAGERRGRGWRSSGGNLRAVSRGTAALYRVADGMPGRAGDCPAYGGTGGARFPREAGLSATYRVQDGMPGRAGIFPCVWRKWNNYVRGAWPRGRISA